MGDISSTATQPSVLHGTARRGRDLQGNTAMTQLCGGQFYKQRSSVRRGTAMYSIYLLARPAGARAPGPDQDCTRSPWPAAISATSPTALPHGRSNKAGNMPQPASPTAAPWTFSCVQTVVPAVFDQIVTTPWGRTLLHPHCPPGGSSHASKLVKLYGYVSQTLTSPRENLRTKRLVSLELFSCQHSLYQSSPSMEPQPDFCYDDLVQS